MSTEGDFRYVTKQSSYMRRIALMYINELLILALDIKYYSMTNINP